jgi:hypothetical protein
MSWSFSDYRPVDKNTLKGTFILGIGPIQILCCGLHRKKGKCWVSFPAFECFEDGKKQFTRLVSIPDTVDYKKFQTWAVNEAERLAQKEKGDELPI